MCSGEFFFGIVQLHDVFATQPHPPQAERAVDRCNNRANPLSPSFRLSEILTEHCSLLLSTVPVFDLIWDLIFEFCLVEEEATGKRKKRNGRAKRGALQEKDSHLSCLGLLRRSHQQATPAYSRPTNNHYCTAHRAERWRGKWRLPRLYCR